MYKYIPQKTAKLIMTENNFTKKHDIILIFCCLSVYEIDVLKNIF